VEKKKKTERVNVYFLIRIGNWKLCSEGLFRYREHRNQSGKTRWHSWDRIL